MSSRFIVDNMMRRLRTAKGGYIIWVGRRCPLTTTVCLISLIDIARRGVRAFVCTIVLPESPANYVAVNVVYSLTDTRQVTSEIVFETTTFE